MPVKVSQMKFLFSQKIKVTYQIANIRQLANSISPSFCDKYFFAPPFTSGVVLQSVSSKRTTAVIRPERPNLLMFSHNNNNAI